MTKNRKYLWDTNILRHFSRQHPKIHQHLNEVSWSQIYIPSIVVAETLRRRIDFALKTDPNQMPEAHQLLMETLVFLEGFEVVIFDDECTKVMKTLKKKFQTKKRHIDVMIAATAIAKQMIVVTRNQKDFKDILPSRQLENWID